MGKQQRTMAVVRFTRQGWHCWPDAPASREYLAQPHRHLFHVEVQLEVFHAEREVEYHDLLDFCRDAFVGGDLAGQSCETLAEALAQKVTSHFPGRSLEVAVFEDGECGAIVTQPPLHSSQRR